MAASASPRGLLPASVGVDALRLRRLLRDELPRFSRLAHVAEVARCVTELKVRRCDHLAAVARTHGCLERPGGQQGALDGIWRLALAEMVLDGVGQRLEEVAIAP